MRNHPAARRPMILATAVLTACLAACGGGGEPEASASTLSAETARTALAVAPSDESATLVAQATTTPAGTATATSATEETASGSESTDQHATAVTRSQLSTSSTTTSTAINSTTSSTLTGDASSATSLVSAAAAMTGLSYAAANPSATTSGVGAVSGCTRGYSAPSSLTASSSVALPASGGLFYTPAELATWRQRVVDGPFVKAGDYTSGSPGDWTRIVANAKRLLSGGEQTITTSTASSTLSTHGSLARDAAFYQLVTGDGTTLSAVRSFLLAQARNSALDFPGTLCITTTDGTTYDAWFYQAAWLLRYIATYDYVRTSLASADRLAIENFVRRNAYFLAAHTDWGLGTVFPNRLSGSYSTRSGAAAASTDAAKWYARRFDTNGSCTVDSSDTASTLPVYAYVKADGTLGPRLSVLSQYYNNRRSAAAAAFGAAGILLGDAKLITSAKRYFMEWLTYGVWADGSQGEYSRNGDYCIAQQGVVYGALNTQGALTLARLLARQGDTTLPAFSTTAGLFGTESTTTAKSLSLAVATHYKLLSGQLSWYYHEPWKSTQAPRTATTLGSMEVRYMNGSTTMDDYHELGYLQAVSLLPSLPVSAWVLRDKTVTSLRFPGSTGNAVSSGYQLWSDGFNTLPAALLLRP